MVSRLTKWERIRAAVRGEEVDRVPVALWKHFPVDDTTPEGLAQATIAFQKKYDWDLLKFTPTGTYGIEDWGAKTVWEPNQTGVRTVVKHGVTDYIQWPTLPPQDATKGYIGNQIKALSLVAKEFRQEVPILQTVFRPLTTARKLAGDRVLSDLLLHPISAIQAQVKEAIRQTGGQRFMIGPGCVVPGNIPEEYLCAVREAVDLVLLCHADPGSRPVYRAQARFLFRLYGFLAGN